MNRIEDFRGLRTLITGASSGIGRLLSLRLAERGARLVLVARRADALDSLRREVEAKGAEAIVLTCDVGELDQVRSCVDRALAHFGNIDVLVNNAGYGNHHTFAEWPLDDIEQMMRVNYLGSVYFTKLLLSQMQTMGNGAIVFIASVAGKLSIPGESAYCASKHAIVGLAGALGIEVEDQGIFVSVINPGAFDTPFFKPQDRERMPEVAKKTMGDPNALVQHILDTLAKGKHEATFPALPRAGYVMNAVAPESMRKQLKRVTAK